MDQALFEAVVRAIRDVGSPSLLALGLLAILWKQTGILRGIQQTLTSMHLTLRGIHSDDYQANSPVRPAASLQPDRGRD